MADNPASIALLEKLIGFETISARSNLELIEFIANYFDKFGIATSLTYDDTKQKANLLARIGPEDCAGLVLSGHTDTVPVSDQKWSSDPFRLRRQDGILVGRGSADMKGFIAAAMGLVPKLVEKSEKLTAPVYFAFTYDEEVGCKGAPKIAAQLAALPFKPKGCIIGEPTSMRLVNGHKGRTQVRCAVHGQETHSAYCDHGVNSVEYAARLILFIRQLMEHRRENGPHYAEFDPPYTTLHSSVIHGGTALNIVPNLCQFEFETRTLPTENGLKIIDEIRHYAETVLVQEMRRIKPDAAIDFDVVSHIPGLATEASHQDGAALLNLVHDLLRATLATDKRKTAPDFDIEQNYKVSYGTEGGVYQGFNIPTLICGPGSINQAHRPDEWIAIEQIAACESFLANFAHKLTE